MEQDKGTHARTTAWHTVGDASDEHERCRYRSPDDAACYMPALWLIQKYIGTTSSMLLCDAHKRALEDLSMPPGSVLVGLSPSEEQRVVGRYEEETAPTVDDYGAFRRRLQPPQRFQSTNGAHPDRKAWETMPIPLSKRAAVWDRTGGRCWYCGEQTNPWRNACIDHVVARVRGGSNAYENLVPACRTCNARKNEKSLEEFRAYLHSRAIPAFTAGQLEYLRGIGVSLPDPLPPPPAYRFWFETQGLTLDAAQEG